MKALTTILLCMSWLSVYSQDTTEDCSHYIDSIADRKVYTFVNKMPEFNNMEKFMANLVTRTKIDSLPEILDTKGKVEFIVEIDGNTSNVVIADKISDQIDNEVVDYVKGVKWKPGFCNDKAVPVRMSIPYIFDYF